MSDPPAQLIVVDDDPINRRLLASYLEREGHAVATANDGRAGWELVRSRPFDVVLLDVLMPEMDGYQVLERIRGDEDLRHLPVIMISSVEDMQSVVRCIELGADDYLPKPFNPVLLRARIAAGLSRKRLHDLEREYLEQVEHVVTAASAVEAGTFAPDALDGVAGRDDALGTLARVFSHMAAEVQARERALKRQVQELRIEIDRTRADRQVEEITGTDAFRDLQRRAAELRSR
ncbi:response regulator [Patulibacter minatonensis]|uniref:response regulator n=1 Tax=Patulibacter minatonensis TaxID=298163 RepID=UPI000478FA24|nr:response regulator [Patulibacter minatonensis]